MLSGLVAVAGDPWDASPSRPPGITVAVDLRFAARVMEVALELTTRGRLLPTLEQAPDGWRARWRPVIDGPDRGRIEALAWLLPHSFPARAAGGEGLSEQVKDTDTFRLLLWECTDALARRLVADRRSGSRKPAGPRRKAPAAIEAWLTALASADGVVDADGDELATLAGRLGEWGTTISSRAEPVRTCFRIVPPADSMDAATDDGDAGEARSGRHRLRGTPPVADEWRIEFDLQAVDDPSLVVSAAAVWDDGPELTALERHVAHPDEHLLRGLGRAARLVPSLGPALGRDGPDRPGHRRRRHSGLPPRRRPGARGGGIRRDGPALVALVESPAVPPAQGPDWNQDSGRWRHHRARRPL